MRACAAPPQPSAAAVPAVHRPPRVGAAEGEGVDLAVALAVLVEPPALMAAGFLRLRNFWHSSILSHGPSLALW